MIVIFILCSISQSIRFVTTKYFCTHGVPVAVPGLLGTSDHQATRLSRVEFPPEFLSKYSPGEL